MFSKSLFLCLMHTGAIIFEMVTGLPPFYTTNRDELFNRIKFQKVKFSSKVSPVLRDLLEKLFEKNPNKRLGGGPTDAEELKNHQWFT